MSTRNKILSAWKNLPSNVTQPHRFRKEIDEKAYNEAKGIVKKLDVAGSNPNAVTEYRKVGNFVRSTKMPLGHPASYTKTQAAIDEAYEQVKKVRREKAKKQGII